MNKLPAHSRIDDIEFLRAVAIIFVLIAHLPVLIGGGPIWEKITSVATFGGGVDLFFVISGFVITRSLLAQPRENFLAFALPFWIRRAWRILPAAWLWLLLTLAATVWFNKSGALGELLPNASDALAAFLQFANIHQYFCLNAVPPVGICAKGGYPLGVYWSLSLEEQFYLVFPFLLFFTPKRYLWPALAFLVMAQIFIPRVGTLLWSIRTDALLIGVLLARQSLNYEPTFLNRPITRTATFLLLVASLAIVPALQFIPFNTGILAVVSGVWVFMASFNKDYVLPVRALKPIMLWFGSRSYSLYLIHLTAYCATQEIYYRLAPEVFGGNYAPRFAISGAILLFVLAELTYRLVEVPLRRRGHAIANRMQQIQMT